MEQANFAPRVRLTLVNPETETNLEDTIPLKDLLEASKEKLIAIAYGYSHVYEFKKNEPTTVAIKDGRFMHIMTDTGAPLYEGTFVQVERFKAGELTTLAMMENPDNPGTFYTTHIDRMGQPIHDLMLIRATKFKPVEALSKAKRKKLRNKKDKEFIPTIEAQSHWEAKVTDITGHDWTIALGDYGVAVYPTHETPEEIKEPSSSTMAITFDPDSIKEDGQDVVE